MPRLAAALAVAVVGVLAALVPAGSASAAPGWDTSCLTHREAGYAKTGVERVDFEREADAWGDGHRVGIRDSLVHGVGYEMCNGQTLVVAYGNRGTSSEGQVLATLRVSS